MKQLKGLHELLKSKDAFKERDVDEFVNASIEFEMENGNTTQFKKSTSFRFIPNHSFF